MYFWYKVKKNAFIFKKKARKSQEKTIRQDAYDPALVIDLLLRIILKSFWLVSTYYFFGGCQLMFL